ncbi:MAG: hypothetical protein NZ521_03985 [Flammeovirgaceae bacterium]|nr:hypothetical protein [Flammeovirgaceae bacterium]MDW8287165.1 hypothetical protein [Flammeovirgaceae bacterium]
MKRKIALLGFLLACQQVKTSQKDKQVVRWDYLLQTWIFLENDEKTGINTYRTKEYDFPPARGRNAYDFQKSGKVIFHTNSPTDRPISLEGTWKLDTLRQVVCIYLDEKNKEKNHCLKIRTLEADKMTAEWR